METITYPDLLSYVPAYLARLGQNVRALELFNPGWASRDFYDNPFISNATLD
ncbi:MAG: hypothetical protein V7K71_04025 [Nostoc sp.]|uniref:hypothetical protein n=1 Tax=Nostoc sp. TaxID=1180 RepID=UPI002FF75C0F